MKQFYFFIIWILFTGNISAQSLFQKTYGDTRDDKGFSGLQTPDSGYVFCGNYSTLTERYFYLVKTDKFGDTLWTKKYRSDRENAAYRMKLTKDTNYIIVGYTGQWQNNYAQDVFLLKVKTNGDSIWGRTYGIPGSYSEYGYDVVECNDGGYMICGSFFATSSSNFYVVRTGSTGIQQWVRNYGVAASSSAKSLVQTLDGYYALAGPVFNSSYNHVGLVKIDSVNATYKWSKNINVGGLEQLTTQVRQLPDSSYLVLASINVSTGNPDMCIVKTNSHGDTIFTKKFAKGRCQYFDHTTDGGYIVTGYTAAFPNKAMLVKLNANFDTLWTRRYLPLSGYSSSTLNEVHQTMDKGYIMTGSSMLSSYTDALLIKADSLGNIVNLVTGMTAAGPKNTLKIFPNPAAHQATIVLPDGSNDRHIKMINAQGIEVKNFFTSGKECVIQLHDLKAGIYTLMVLDADDHDSIIAVKQIIVE